ncbi:cytochrome o ubiquinol oxidase subunit III [Aureimonas leprariae]|uniref:Cytochrome bo(3) ubiquinol oxidase subunit 3 n=1 Tax=Plantimonas leprariae TaxID=2615207 RepID=A0A7V7PTC6_9HYPH|nr:cytochrome o ubiquinol oxidase subunit III [Aureimonas leprariae]
MLGHGRGETSREGDPYNVGHGAESDAPGHGAGGPAPKRIVVGYGFWIFLLSDIIMFSAFFAAFAVLRGETAGGPSGRELFDLPFVAVETTLLLVSSFFCGMAGIAIAQRNMLWFQAMMAVTFVFGAGFLVMEVYEFHHLVTIGAGPSRSAFLSSFFALVGCHGLHVFGGCLWLLTMMAQVFVKGFRPTMERRFLCFSLFWHALDIIWVAVFTIVYLFGAG